MRGCFFILLLAGCTHAFGDRRYDSDGGLGDTADGSDGGACACNSPPANVCLDQTALRVQVAVGTCNAGACSYDHWDVLCENGCHNGACIGNDPCDGVMCIKPPGSSCVDANTLMTYSTSGTCSMGQCSYPSTHTTCAGGCESGACTGDPCAGISCDAPPATICKDSNTLRGYSATGRCDSGACSYTTVDTSCTNGCVNGTCSNDLCVGVLCVQAPAPSCLNSTTRRSYGLLGICSNGTCSYTASDVTCPNGCAAGVCNDSCGGIACNSPPAATCANSTTRRVYASTGTCANGACSYATSDVPCPTAMNATATCTGGVCSLTCNSGTTVCSEADTGDGEIEDRINYCANLNSDVGDCGYCGSWCNGGTCSAGHCSVASLLECQKTPISFSTCSQYCTSVGRTCSTSCGGAYARFFDLACTAINTSSGTCSDQIDVSSSILGIRCCCK